MTFNRREILASLNCMRCNSRDKVAEYDYSETVGSKKISKNTTQYTIAHLYVPICTNCKRDFEIHKKYNDKKIWGQCGCTLSGCVLFIVYINFMISNTSSSPLDTIWQLLAIVMSILAVISAIHLLVISSKAGAMVENPKKYMKFIKKQPFVRPKGVLNWIPYSEWIKSAVQEKYFELQQNMFENVGNIYSISEPEIIKRDKLCKNCGKLLSPTEKFCVNCGSKIE